MITNIKETNAIINAVEFSYCTLKNNSFLRSSFNSVDFFDCSIDYNDLSFSKINYGYYYQIGLVESIFSNTFFYETRLEHIHYQACNFKKATFYNSRILKSNFEQCSLEMVVLKNTKFDECVFKNTDFSFLSGESTYNFNTFFNCTFENCKLPLDVLIDISLTKGNKLI
jgi:uncharacterized protein YjbI with pentapeptide repeats